MAERGSWTGGAAETARRWQSLPCPGRRFEQPGLPGNPRALAGRLRRAQTFLRALGIDIAFAREGRAGNRIIRMHTTLDRQQRPHRGSHVMGHNRPGRSPSRIDAGLVLEFAGHLDGIDAGVLPPSGSLPEDRGKSCAR